MKIKISQSDWEKIGIKMGWMKTAQAGRLGIPGEESADRGYIPTGIDAALFDGLPKGARNEIIELSKMTGAYKNKMKRLDPDSVEYKNLEKKIDRINNMIAEIKAKYSKPESGPERGAEDAGRDFAALIGEGVIPEHRGAEN